MKFRTDFVTNSSSSSFVAELTVSTKDGKSFSTVGRIRTATEAWKGNLSLAGSMWISGMFSSANRSMNSIC